MLDEETVALPSRNESGTTNFVKHTTVSQDSATTVVRFFEILLPVRMSGEGVESSAELADILMLTVLESSDE